MRIVVKVGTSVIAPNGSLDAHRMRMLVDQLDLAKNEYLIVTSGAIAAGMTELEIKRRPRSIPAMQACAAVGQCTLMQTYQGLFFGKKHVAQLLLTSDDFLLPLRYRNLRNTLAELLRLGVLPIINENDSVSVRELVGAFGDNDELSALVAVSVEADWLILLTNVDGFLGHNGTGNHKLVRAVRYVTQAMEAECNGQSHLGRGGMRSKLRAARLAAAAGIQVAIANGSHPDVLRSAVERRTGTYFFPQRGTHNPWPPRLLSQVEPATN